MERLLGRDELLACLEHVSRCLGRSELGLELDAAIGEADGDLSLGQVELVLGDLLGGLLHLECRLGRQQAVVDLRDGRLICAHLGGRPCGVAHLLGRHVPGDGPAVQEGLGHREHPVPGLFRLQDQVVGPAAEACLDLVEQGLDDRHKGLGHVFVVGRSTPDRSMPGSKAISSWLRRYPIVADRRGMCAEGLPPGQASSCSADSASSMLSRSAAAKASSVKACASGEISAPPRRQAARHRVITWGTRAPRSEDI